MKKLYFWIVLTGFLSPIVVGMLVVGLASCERKREPRRDAEQSTDYRFFEVGVHYGIAYSIRAFHQTNTVSINDIILQASNDFVRITR